MPQVYFKRTSRQKTLKLTGGVEVEDASGVRMRKTSARLASGLTVTRVSALEPHVNIA